MKINTGLPIAFLGWMILTSCGEETRIAAEPSGGSGGGAQDAPADGKPGACPEGLPGPKLVRLPAADGSFYCMDEREVVNEEYKQFVAALEGKAIPQPAECKWNTRLTPELALPGDDDPGFGKCPSGSWKLDSEPTFAVNCVDFCDAWAYCQWAGKRLCGVQGATSELNIQASQEAAEKLGSALSSEWYNACTQGGSTNYPYGDSYVPARCVDPTKLQQSGTASRATKDLTADTCQGSKADFSGVHHLSGNVWEWLNICADGGVSCARQGGARDVATTDDLACKSWGLVAAATISSLYGFRCCADGGGSGGA